VIRVVSRRRDVRRALLAAVAAMATAGCSPGEAEPASDGTQAADPAPPPVPELSGPSEAAEVGTLPDGPATGSIVISYDGLGEVRSPFTGTCSHDGSSSELRGTAGEANVVLVFDTAGATLTVEDVGLQSEAALASGDLRAEGNRLILAAPLVTADQAIGDVELNVICGN
jgi:hypothetical protein